MPLTPDQHDEMRWDDDGAPHIDGWQEVYDSGPGHPRWIALQALSARIIREVNAMPPTPSVDALADDIVAEAVSWAGRVGGPFSIALDRAEAWLTIMDMSNSDAGEQ